MIKKPLTSYINLGPTIVKNINAIGVHTIDDLQKIGPAGVYRKLKSKLPNKVWPVCYYLYSLEGALTNTYWDDIPQKKKDLLLKEVGR